VKGDVTVSRTRKSRRKPQFTAVAALRCDPAFVARVDQAARQLGLSRSSFVRFAAELLLRRIGEDLDAVVDAPQSAQDMAAHENSGFRQQ